MEFDLFCVLQYSQIIGLSIAYNNINIEIFPLWKLELVPVNWVELVAQLRELSVIIHSKIVSC